MKNKEIFTLYRYVRILLMHWGLDCYMWQIPRRSRDRTKMKSKNSRSWKLEYFQKMVLEVIVHFSTKNLVKISFREQCALSSSFLRPSKYSLHGGEEDRAREILHRGCSRNFVVLTSRDIFYGKPPFFLRPSPLQRDRTSSLHDI